MESGLQQRMDCVARVYHCDSNFIICLNSQQINQLFDAKKECVVVLQRCLTEESASCNFTFLNKKSQN